MKKIHKRSALGEKLKAGAGVKLQTVITDARVLNLRGPRLDVVVTVPLALLPEWYALHQVEPVGYNVSRAVLSVKRLTDKG